MHALNSPLLKRAEATKEKVMNRKTGQATRLCLLLRLLLAQISHNNCRRHLTFTSFLLSLEPASQPASQLRPSPLLKEGIPVIRSPSQQQTNKPKNQINVGRGCHPPTRLQALKARYKGLVRVHYCFCTFVNSRREHATRAQELTVVSFLKKTQF